MTITTVNQLDTSDGRLYAHEDCGLCCALSLALDTGLPRDETVASMEAWYTAHGDSPADGTGLAVNAAWLVGEGLDASAFSGTFDVVEGYLAQGWRCMLAIWSNTYGTPYSGPGCVGHFVEVCADNGNGTFAVMQPVGGTLVNYTRAQLSDNSQDGGVVVRHDYRSAPVTTVIGTTSGGTGMTNPQDVAAVVKLAYDVLAIRKAMQAHGIDPGQLKADATDPTGFDNQVNAVLQGKADLHTVVNNITEAS